MYDWVSEEAEPQDAQCALSFFLLRVEKLIVKICLAEQSRNTSRSVRVKGRTNRQITCAKPIDRLMRRNTLIQSSVSELQSQYFLFKIHIGQETACATEVSTVGSEFHEGFCRYEEGGLRRFLREGSFLYGKEISFDQ